MSEKRFAAYFNGDVLGSRSLSTSPLNEPTVLSRPSPPSPISCNVQPVPRKPPLRQFSCDSYMASYSGEPHFRTPSGELYRNQAFAKALHRPSTPIITTFPKTANTSSYISSPLSCTSSQISRETPPTTPEPSEEYVCIDPHEATEERTDGKATIDLRSCTAMSLWNDYHATELLIQLASGSPSFHQYEHPPRRVLDLGCGEGTWAKYAATKWNSPETHIDGLDIQPLWESSRRPLGMNALSARVSWKLADFFNRLPYDDNTFDLVRAANLALSVPHSHWLPLLREIRRILRVGGRLELVEDEFFFPPIQHGSVSHAPQERPSHTGLIPSESENERISKFREVEESKRTAEYLENAFGSMLANKYDIWQPHTDYLRDILPQAFGDKHILSYPSQQIAVPRRSPDGTGKSNEGLKAPRKISLSTSQGSRILNHGSELVLPSTAAPKAVQVLSTGRRPGDLPTVVSPKAAKILGNSDSASSRPYQPAGFLVLPNKFFECRPEVLEMHACRNMHIVLSCKKALQAYLREHKDVLTDLGPELTGEEFERIFENAMWEYDSFKRRRLNWPDNYPGLLMPVDDEDSEASTTRNIFSLVEGRRRAQSTSCTLVPPLSAENCTQIRVVRIFGAIKAKELG